MLTVIAWMVFVPAVIWNLIFFAVAMVTVFESKEYNWLNRRNIRDSAISLAAMILPGIYLFGIW